MTPNLRYNKKMTKHLIKASTKNKTRKDTIDWNIDNNFKKIYGIYDPGIFNNTYFILQKMDNDVYRIINIFNRNKISFYLIEDIEEFLDMIGVEELISDSIEDTLKLITETVKLPSSGIIHIEDGRVYMYEHTNY